MQDMHLLIFLGGLLSGSTLRTNIVSSTGQASSKIFGMVRLIQRF